MTDIYTPPRFEHHPENVPEELKAADTWVCCDENKVPLVATRSGAVYAASSTDKTTWRSYEDAYEAWLENEWSYVGIGRVIRADEDLVGVDLDKCLNPDTGELTPWAAAILASTGSYQEISPSTRGVKVWGYAPGLDRAHVKPGLEIYPKGRYFTVTGNVLNAESISPIGDALAEIIAEEFPRVDRDRTPYNGPSKTHDLLDYLERANVEIFAELSDGSAERVYAIRCLWADEHTKETSTTSTRVGQYADGATFYRCEHAHCREARQWQQFRAECDPIVYLGRCRRSKGRLR